MVTVRFDRDGPHRTDADRTLALVPSLGTTRRIWDGVVALLHAAMPTTEVFLMDLPGHGFGDAAQVAFTVEELAAEATLALDAVRSTARVTVAGVSMGGAVALEMARRRPLASFAMFNSAARFGSRVGWLELMARVHQDGTASLRPESAGGWFTPGFRQRRPDLVDRLLDELACVDDSSYLWCCNALAMYDATDALATVTVPALLVAGGQDRATTAGMMREVASAIPSAEFVEIPDGAHLAVVEQPERAAAVLGDLMRYPSPDDHDLERLPG